MYQEASTATKLVFSNSPVPQGIELGHWRNLRLSSPYTICLQKPAHAEVELQEQLIECRVCRVCRCYMVPAVAGHKTKTQLQIHGVKGLRHRGLEYLEVYVVAHGLGFRVAGGSKPEQEDCRKVLQANLKHSSARGSLRQSFLATTSSRSSGRATGRHLA